MKLNSVNIKIKFTLGTPQSASEGGGGNQDHSEEFSFHLIVFAKCRKGMGIPLKYLSFYLSQYYLPFLGNILCHKDYNYLYKIFLFSLNFWMWGKMEGYALFSEITHRGGLELSWVSYMQSSSLLSLAVFKVLVGHLSCSISQIPFLLRYTNGSICQRWFTINLEQNKNK